MSERRHRFINIYVRDAQDTDLRLVDESNNIIMTIPKGLTGSFSTE